MKNPIALGLLSTLGMVSAASCGGESADFDAGHGARAGRAGSNSGAAAAAGHGAVTSTTGGTTSTGGTRSSNGGTSIGGTSGGGSGGARPGGSSGTVGEAGHEPGGTGGSPHGGEAGTLGHAGTAGIGPCPSTPPEIEQGCDAASTCVFPGLRCECGGPPDARTWHCHGSGGACPPSEPEGGSNCENPMGMPLDCPYAGDVNCHCMGENWMCEGPPPAPGAGGAPDDISPGGRPSGPGPGGPGPGGPGPGGPDDPGGRGPGPDGPPAMGGAP